MTSDPGRKPVLHTKKHLARLERERRQTRLILYVFIGILVIVLTLVGYGILDQTVLQLDRPVARVGEVEIPARDFEAQVRLQRQQLLNSYSINMQYAELFGIDTQSRLEQIQNYLDTPALLGSTVLNQMIDDELIRQEAARQGIQVSPQEVEQELRETFGYYPEGTPTPTAVPADPLIPAEAYRVVTQTPVLPPTQTPAATVTAAGTPAASPTPLPTATPYTLEGYESEYRSTLDGFTRFGISEQGYRRMIETQILREQLVEAVAGDVSTTEEQIWARHILVDDAVQAAAIIERLNAGEDFGQLAVDFSKDTGSAVNGGDLGWFGEGAMVPEFQAAAFALENPGEITQAPVQSQFGYHIIQLIARQDRPRDAAAIEDERTGVFNEWLAGIRGQYTIETYEDFWLSRMPTEPNFITQATESAQAAETQQAESAAEGTPSP